MRLLLTLAAAATAAVISVPASAQAPDPGLGEPPPAEEPDVPAEVPVEPLPEPPPEDPHETDPPEADGGDGTEGRDGTDGRPRVDPEVHGELQGEPAVVTTTTGPIEGGGSPATPGSFAATSNARDEPAADPERGYDDTLPYAVQDGDDDLTVPFSIGGGVLLLIVALQMRYVAMRAAANDGG